MGPIWATRIWANPYGTHAKPGCTPHMGSPYGTHIGMFAGLGLEGNCSKPVVFFIWISLDLGIKAT